MDFSQHKFRASSFGNLMTGATGPTEAQIKLTAELEAKKIEPRRLTDKQQELFDKLSLKDSLTEKETETLSDLMEKGSGFVGLTEKQQETLDDLIYKRDHFELSKGAKTYLRKLRREVKFNRRRELKSKYLTKGIELEEEAITFLSLYHGQIFENNKGRVFDDYFQGECDIPEGYDTKVAWELDTLPDPKEPLDTVYEYQDRVYMRLYGNDWWVTASIVMNMTDTALKDVLYREGFRWPDNEIPKWRMVEIIAFYTYDEETFYTRCKQYDCLPDIVEYQSQVDRNEINPILEKHVDMFTGFVEIPDYERIVEKTVNRDLEIEEKMIEVAIAARAYLNELEVEMESKIK